jgi:hypothetical protein
MAQLKKDPYFEGIEWDKLAAKKYKPPVKLNKPEKMKKDEDLSNIFHDTVSSSTAQGQQSLKKMTVFTDSDYTESNKNYNRVRNYSFVRS